MVWRRARFWLSGITSSPRSGSPDVTTCQERSAMAILISRRLALGFLTILLVSVLVFAATEVLPGDAARAVLGRGANATTLAALRRQLRLDASVPVRYERWLKDLCTGHLGVSLGNGEPGGTRIGPRVANSAVLLGLT